MRRMLFAVLSALLLAGPAWTQAAKDKDSDKNATTGKTDAKKDSSVVAGAKKKLEAKVGPYDFKDEPLSDVLKKLGEDGEVKFYQDSSAPKQKVIQYTSKEEKPLKDVLDEMFKKYDLGYIVHRKDKDNDRYEGWILVKAGAERGDEGDPKKDTGKKDTKTTKPAAEKPDKGDKSEKPAPKPPAGGNSGGGDEDKAEKTAAYKLKTAKVLIDDSMLSDAKEILEEIVKKFSQTKAAEEAKTLLEKLK